MTDRRWRAPVVALALLALIGPAVAALAGEAAITIDGEAVQGALLIGHAPPGSRVDLDGRPAAVADDGRFLVGLGRDAPPAVRLSLRLPDGRRVVRTIAVRQRRYAVQRIDGLPPAKVTPSPEALARIRREQARIDAARARRTPVTWFDSGFQWPLTGRVSGVYGSQRVLNGKPRRPHLGVDIAAPEGTPVHAPADGVVVLADPDLYFTGGTLIIDHGLGLSSVLAHLSRLTVIEGEHVRRGEPVGAVGATGRATGPHLHWGMNLGPVRLDPALVAGPMGGRRGAGPRPTQSAAEPL